MPNLYTQCRSWLHTPEADRDFELGARLAFRIHANPHRHRAILRAPQATLSSVVKILSDYVARIDATPSADEAAKIKEEARKLTEKPVPPAKEFKAGKRADHDSLPKDIQQIFERNMDLRRKMSQYHLEIRNLLKSKKDCAPADLRPLVELLKNSDEVYRRNWAAYDAYGKKG